MKTLSAIVALLLMPFALAREISGRPAGGPGSFNARRSRMVSNSATLRIYFIDVEGGASTLIVTPAGESVLVDAGWPGYEDRDAKRIQRAMQAAGVAEIDHMIATHYHIDHYGGIPAIAKAVPVKHFYDHGKMSSLAEDQNFSKLYSAYQSVTDGRSSTLKPGDTISLKSAPGAPPVKLLCVAGNGQVIGGGSYARNSSCAGAKLEDPDPSDNARSLGFILTFGRFRFLDLGDLTWNVEQALVCPSNKLGHIDLYQVTHHGMNISNNPVLLQAVQPTVAVMDNGPHKGGHPDTVERLKTVSSVKALYQLHRNVESAAAQNSAADFIANPEENPDKAYMITVSVDPGKHTFTVTNERTGISNNYPLH